MTKTKNKKPLLARRPIMIAVALFCCMLWGSAFVGIVTNYDLLNVNTDDVFQITLFAGLRFLLASASIFLFAFFAKQDMRLKRSAIIGLILLGLFQTFGQYLFLFLSLRTVHPANATILSAFGVFMSVTLSHFLMKTDKLNLQKAIGVILGMVGIIILTGGGGGAGFSFQGEGFMLLGTSLGAFGGVFTKRLATQLSAFAITAYQLLFGATLLIIKGAVFSSDVAFTFTLASSSLLLYLAFVSAAAFTLWAALLKHNEISKVAIYEFAIPVFGVFFSFLFFDEAFDIITIIIALTLVSIGIFLLNLPDDKQLFKRFSSDKK